MDEKTKKLNMEELSKVSGGQTPPHSQTCEQCHRGMYVTVKEDKINVGSGYAYLMTRRCNYCGNEVQEIGPTMYPSDPGSGSGQYPPTPDPGSGQYPPYYRPKDI